jgi:L-ascorbate metabolism protein UlaG (beta-lactamase superfamily)
MTQEHKMTQTRRNFLTTAAAGAGAITILPFKALADGHSGNSFETPKGPIKVHSIAHASVIMETPAGTVFVDPVGDPARYGGKPAPDLILITHEHGDHFNAETVTGILKDDTQIITNPAVFAKIPDDLKARSTEIANGAMADFKDVSVEAIPAYNLTQERQKFHPKGRDNGYVLTFEGFRVYLSGDTEDIPEMRALKDIDLAFVCMNLPFTMDANAAASAVSEFAPSFVYPYHYRGKDGGTQDPEAFAKMVSGDTQVKLAPWYA